MRLNCMRCAHSYDWRLLLPIRLMVSLLHLKCGFDESDDGGINHPHNLGSIKK